MSDTLPPSHLLDPAVLATSMHDANYVSAGLNNAVWRLEGGHVLRVSKDRRDMFTSTEAPPIAKVLPTASLKARAAQPFIAFYATDEKGVEHRVADVQPEIVGELIGLSIPERDSRTIRDVTIRAEDELVPFGDNMFLTMPKGSERIKITDDLEAIAATNAKMLDLQRRLLELPDTFFAQAIKDVLEIEEAGYELDPSKSQNFCLLSEEGRLGFYDLNDQSRGRKLPPCELATVLSQPANHAYYTNEPEEVSAMRQEMIQAMKARVVCVCDALGIPYAPEYNGNPNDDEQKLREKFGITKPEGIPKIQIDEKGMVRGCGVKSADIDLSRVSSVKPMVSLVLRHGG